MKTLTIKSGKLILTLIMMIVLLVACSGPEEDFEPIQQDPPQEAVQPVEEADIEEEEDEPEVEIPVRLAMEFAGNDFSTERKKAYFLENYSQQSGDRIEINLVRVVDGLDVMYKIPGTGWNENTTYNVFYTLPNDENPYPGFEVSVSSGNGERYDKVVVLVRNSS